MFLLRPYIFCLFKFEVVENVFAFAESQRNELQNWVSSMESGRQLLQKSIQESKTPMELVLLKKQFGDRLQENVNADLPPGPRENTLLR